MRRRQIRTGVSAGFFILDATALGIAFEVAFRTRFYMGPFLNIFPVTKGNPGSAIYQQALYILLPIWLLVFFYTGAYRELFQSAYDEMARLMKAVVICALLTMTLSFSYRGVEYSRLVIGVWAFYSIIFTYTLREIGKSLLGHLQKWAVGPQQILIIGKGKAMEAIRQMVEQRPFVETHFLDALPQNESLEQFVLKHHISDILLVPGGLPSHTVLDTAAACEQLNIPCKIVPDMLELRRGEIIVDGSLGLPTFRIKPLSLHGVDYLLKRTFDILLSLLLLTVLFLPCLLIALLIRFNSPGPIFHTQPRLGYRARPFKFYKFRTMVQNADQLLAQLKAFSDRAGPVFKMKLDPRVTWVGRWLRQYSLDELPQIFNVLRGDMSLVGPRPQVLWEAEHYDETAKKRLRVKPGITGLWQVSGRAALSYEDMIHLDIYYLENWSLGLDLKILVRTLPAIFAGHGAY